MVIQNRALLVRSPCQFIELVNRTFLRIHRFQQGERRAIISKTQVEKQEGKSQKRLNLKKQSQGQEENSKIAKALQQDDDQSDEDDLYLPRKINKPNDSSSIKKENQLPAQPRDDKLQINEKNLQSLWEEVLSMKKQMEIEQEQLRIKQEQDKLIALKIEKERQIEIEIEVQRKIQVAEKLKQLEIENQLEKERIKLKEQEKDKLIEKIKLEEEQIKNQKEREKEIEKQKEIEAILNEKKCFEKLLQQESASQMEEEKLTQILLIQEIAICSEKEAKDALDLTKDFDKAVEIILKNKRQIIQEEKDGKIDDFEEKIQTLVSLEICTKEEAREALKKYGDFELTLHYINEKMIEKNALEYCLGDKRIQQELLTSDIAQVKEEILILNTLNPVQINALKYVSKKAKLSSDAAYPSLLDRVKRLGFSRDDLDKTLIYIRDDAPIIIHFNLAKVLKFFVASDRYKNQFETNMSGGCLSHPSRVQWEDALFGKVYHSSNGRDRVKYGVLNIVKDTHGIKCCAAYGRSFFVLKNVKLRTTLANGDTGGGNQELATCLYYCSVLNKYHDNELRSVIECATGIKKFGDDSQVISSYKEAQIHGDIFFQRDVQSLFYSNAELKATKKDETLDLLEKFRTQFRVEIIPIDD